jgi:hypothetical protein
MTDLIGIPEACKRSGHCRTTLQRWIDVGWLRTEEIPHGSGVRQFVTIEALREAQETAANAPKEERRIWFADGEERLIPREGSRQYRSLHLWLRWRGRGLLDDQS